MLRYLGKLLSIGDLLCIIVLLFHSWLPYSIIQFSAMFLIIKGGLFAFMGDKVSFVDILCGIYILILGFGFSVGFITAIFVIFLAQKTLMMFLF